VGRTGVKTHRRHIFAKFGITTPAAPVTEAARPTSRSS
jgi:hypothetical protein